MSPDALTLLIDAGNTRVKFGWVCQASGRRHPGALALGHDELDGLAAWLAALPRAPEAVLGVNVAGDAVAARIALALRPLGGIPLRWLRSSASVAGIENGYEDPAHLGTDRWISLAGLAGHTPATALLATFGTATTIDTLGPRAGPGGARRFEGGVILPGPELMRRSLASGTAGLPYAQGDSVALPRNTHAAIQSGIAAAQAGAVIRQWRGTLDALGEAPLLYCAGGGWPLVAGEVAAALARAQADLGLPAAAPQWLDAPVLDGLARLATSG